MNLKNRLYLSTEYFADKKPSDLSWPSFPKNSVSITLRVFCGLVYEVKGEITMTVTDAAKETALAVLGLSLVRPNRVNPKMTSGHPFAELSVPQDSVAIHWFEQNSYTVKDSCGTIVQIDPYFPHKRPAEVFIHAEPPLDESQLPTNYVLVTHSHGDHTCSETLGRIHKFWPEAKYVGPKESIAKILNETEIDVNQTRTIAAGESVKLDTMTAHAVYAKPPDGDAQAKISPPDVTHLGYVLEAGGVRLYISGDIINTFANHDSLVNPVAVLKPDIGFLTIHPTEGEFPFFDGGVLMAQRIGFKAVVPSHRACFVKRDYDPNEWAKLFLADGPRPLIIPHNSHIIYPG